MLQNIRFDWSEFCARESTDKKFKLHIVTEFKVIINSLSPFGFRYLGGGMGFTYKRKSCDVTKPSSWKALMMISAIANLLLFVARIKWRIKELQNG